MMGPRQVEPAAPFYEYSFDIHVPADRLLRSIDGFVDLAYAVAEVGRREDLLDGGGHRRHASQEGAAERRLHQSRVQAAGLTPNRT
jgi:hypothetical protein